MSTHDLQVLVMGIFIIILLIVLLYVGYKISKGK